MKIISNTFKIYTKTIGNRNDVDNTIALPLLIQAIFGQQILNPNWSWRNKSFKHIQLISLIIYVIFGTIDFMKQTTDNTSKGEACYTFLIIFIFLIKYFIFVYNREQFQKVYFIAKTTLFEIINKISIKKSMDMLYKIKILVKLFFGAVLLPQLGWIMTAIWLNLHGEKVTLSQTTSILMPMTSPYYEIGFILHAVFLFYMAFTICVIDLWFVITMVFFCETSDCLVIMLKVEVQRENELELEYAERLNNKLRAFYQNHEKLMEYLNVLTDMYKWPAVVPLISVLFSSCLLMFLTLSEEIQWRFLVMFVPTLGEIFAYNWFGEQLKLKATELNMALMDFDWPSMKLADKKNYLIIVTYMNKEFSIRTPFGNDLSLNTMTDVLKASYQAFTLLKTMEV